MNTAEQTRAVYRAFPGLARRAARRDPATAVDRFLMERRIGLAFGAGFTVLNVVRGAWAWLALTVVLIGVDVSRIRRAQAHPDRVVAAAESRHAIALELRDARGAVERIMSRAATALGIEVGQAYTVVLGAAVAIALLVSGLPAALRGPGALAEAATPVGAAKATTAPATIPTVPDAGGVAPTPAPPLPFSLPATVPQADGLPPTSMPVASPTTAMVTVVAASWATTDPAVFAGASGSTVPADGLPVEARAGQVAKVSFLRVQGTGSQLRLVLTAGPSDNVLVDSAAILVCRITSPSWAPAPGQPLANAPTYDCTKALAVTRDAQGGWIVPLGAVPTTGGERNIALVPAGTAASVFRVTFQRPTGS